MKYRYLLFALISINTYAQVRMSDSNIIRLYKYIDNAMALRTILEELKYDNAKVYLFESDGKVGNIILSCFNGKKYPETLQFTKPNGESNYFAGYVLPQGQIAIDSVNLGTSGASIKHKADSIAGLYHVKFIGFEPKVNLLSKCSSSKDKIDSLKNIIEKYKKDINNRIDTSTYKKCNDEKIECDKKNDFLCGKLTDAVKRSISLAILDSNYINQIHNQKKWLKTSSDVLTVVGLVGAIYSGLEWHNDNKNIVNYRNDYLAATNTIDAHDASIKHGDALKKRNFEMAAFSASLAIIPIAIYQYTRYRKIENASQTCKDKIRNLNKIIPCNVEIKSDGKKHGVDLTFQIK